MSSTPVIPLHWFKRWGWFYLPIHAFGWLTSLAAFAFVAHIFVMLDEHAHSVTDMLYQFYVFAAPTFLGLMWIASRTSDENGGRS